MSFSSIVSERKLNIVYQQLNEVETVFADQSTHTKERINIVDGDGDCHDIAFFISVQNCCFERIFRQKFDPL
jgi:hypothetical protein